MREFLRFIAKKSYIKADSLLFDEKMISLSFEKTIKDVQYHYPEITNNEIVSRIQSNQNELPLFLFRLGNTIWETKRNSKSLLVIHWLMKELCSCEIYYSLSIDEGFYIMHGVGTVIGSRHKIGKGFVVFQNCQIGHKRNGGKGSRIGENVTLFAGSTIVGEIKIGNDVIIGAASFVNRDIPDSSKVYGNPIQISHNRYIGKSIRERFK